MNTLGNDVYVTRGETWTYDATIVNNDGSPYIVSNQYPNPYYLFKLSSDLYKINNRYYEEIWCPIDANATFYCSEPLQLTEFPEAFKISDLSSDAQKDLRGDTKKEGLNLSNYAVYYMIDNDGNTIYKHWIITGDIDENGDSPGKWEDYVCNFRLAFMSRDTVNWTAQTYIYKLDVVSGEKINKGNLNTDDITHSNHIVEGRIIVAGNLDSNSNGGTL